MGWCWAAWWGALCGLTWSFPTSSRSLRIFTTTRSSSDSRTRSIGSSTRSPIVLAVKALSERMQALDSPTTRPHDLDTDSQWTVDWRRVEVDAAVWIGPAMVNNVGATAVMSLTGWPFRWARQRGKLRGTASQGKAGKGGSATQPTPPHLHQQLQWEFPSAQDGAHPRRGGRDEAGRGDGGRREVSGGNAR